MKLELYTGSHYEGIHRNNKLFKQLNNLLLNDPDFKHKDKFQTEELQLDSTDGYISILAYVDLNEAEMKDICNYITNKVSGVSHIYIGDYIVKST